MISELSNLAVSSSGVATSPSLSSEEASSSASPSPHVQLPAISLPPKSLLPAWLLATTSAVEALAAQRNLVEERLVGLQRDTLALEGHIDRARPCYSGRMLARLQAARERGEVTAATEDEKEAAAAPAAPVRKAQGLHRLPAELTSIVASFLPDAIALLRFARCSRATSLYMCSDDAAGWAGLWRRHALFVWDLVPTLDLRCVEVVRKQGSQRRGPSYGRVAAASQASSSSLSPGGAAPLPLDKAVGTAKLPLPRSGGGSSSSPLSSTATAAASTEARVSTQSLRAQVTHHCAATHRSFKFINRVRLERSHKRSSDPLGRAARSRGTSHPLPLLNAGGALDEKIMSQANSMNKDARQEALRVLEIMALLTANAQDQVTLSGLRRCGAVTVLVALLANESGAIQELACATLANLLVTRGVMSPLDLCPRHVMNQCNGKVALRALLTSPGARISTISSVQHTPGSNGPIRMHGGGTSLVNLSTFCMGMASKHAARALCNLWCPDYEIGRGMLEDGEAVPWDLDALDKWPSEGQHHEGRGNAAEGSTANREGPGGAQAMRNEHLAYFDRLLLVGTGPNWPSQSKTWMAFYWYSSGTEKDESPVELSLTSDGRIEGRGYDNLGQFVIVGKTSAVRLGALQYSFHKTYIDRGSSVPAEGHVSHVAFWAGDGTEDGGGAACADAGFWGVWELVTGEPHFELQGGGVFRFVPVPD